MPSDARPLTVLVLDDEPSVLDVLRLALRQYGLDTMLASRGDDAVELFARHGDRIDVVLLDVKMPEIDGLQTLAALRRLCPGLRVRFMSGAAVGPYSAEDLRATGAAAFLVKPFDRAEVARTLRQAAAAAV